MIRRLSVGLLALVVMVLAVSLVSLAQPQALVTRNVYDVVVNGEVKLVGPLPATQSMRIVMVLPLRHEPELENFLQELYDPTSSSYRHFLTVEEFTARFGPSQEDYDALASFAKANGFTVVQTSRNRLNLDVTGTVASIEKALHVTMNVYQHPTENRTFYSPDREPTVNLPFQLWHVSGLDNYSIPRPLVQRRDEQAQPQAVVGSGPGNSFLGSDMRAAYYGGSTLTGAGQSLGLLEFLGTDLVDLKTYYKNVGQTNNVPITLLSTDGTSVNCVYPSCDDTEQTLDMTQSLGMAPGMSSLVMYVGSSDPPIFNAMATASPLNAQLSSSWTWSNADPSTDLPYFEEFEAQGQNLFQAAGDSGKWSPLQHDVYPSDSVFVTSVGGTDLETASAGGPWSSETAWSDGGGGISPHHYAIPSWQVAAAATCADCSQTYRNGPDVSANANFTFYVCSDQRGCTANEEGGTSFAAPMWAGYLALANQQMVANGNPTLGFINPALYTIGLSSSYDTDFHDITSGSNGFPATTGYDLATGWGSPNGANLINALTGPAGPGFSLSANPTTVSVAVGKTGTSTITVVPLNGFSGNVTLSASGLPSGVTAGFSPNPTGTTSTLTFTVSSSAATGSSTVTITGTSGSLTNTTTVTLTVTGSASFSLTANPTAVSVAQGSNGTSTITVVPANGFTGSVTLSASGLPTGVTAGFAPNPTTTTSTLTLTASATAATGTSTVTITGTSGSLTATTSVQLTVTSSGGGPAVTLSPTSLTWGGVVVGETGAPKTVTLTNSGTGTLSISSITGTGDFAVAPNTAKNACGTTVAVGASCTVKVTFTPTQVGTRTGSLLFTDNAPGSPQSVALSGTGNPQAKLTPAAHTYPAQTVGTSSTAFTFTLANKQNVALTAISLSTTGDFSISTTTCTSSLGPNSSCTIGVIFTPSKTGTRTGTLEASDSAFGSPQISNLTGTGK